MYQNKSGLIKFHHRLKLTKGGIICPTINTGQHTLIKICVQLFTTSGVFEVFGIKFPQKSIKRYKQVILINQSFSCQFKMKNCQHVLSLTMIYWFWLKTQHNHLVEICLHLFLNTCIFFRKLKA